ncbi:MAG: type II toxin-antitoxin system VapC family toxin [Deltaproteobacteria bacterium]|nr:type II toxin-antitoxin system VapC family toxin [Deltaproteobacteria bacterium]
MKSFVIDNSVVMAWFFEDEASDYTVAVLESLTKYDCIVPSIWPLEVANTLLVGERRGRATEAKAARFITLLNSLPIQIDPETSRHALLDTLQLAREHHLSSYDAAYLELAMREGVPIATQDKALKKAAKKCGVKLI